MNYDKHRYLLETVRSLRKHGSWTGKTHVVKTLAMVDLVSGTPFDFILYKHGPYSFDVDDELSQMRTYDAVVSVPQGGYGPSLESGSGARFVEAGSDVPESRLKLIDTTSKFLAKKSVSELEATVTSAWIKVREGIQGVDAIANRLVELKPHIALSTAREAAKEAIEFVDSQPKS